MADSISRRSARLGWRSIHPILVPLPIGCFLGALLTDIAYARTADILWGDFSDWLITVGLAVLALAIIAGAAELVFDSRVRALPRAWIHVGAQVLAFVFGLFDEFVHTRDAYGQAPLGLLLSVLTLLVLLGAGWLGWDMVPRDRALAAEENL